MSGTTAFVLIVGIVVFGMCFESWCGRRPRPLPRPSPADSNPPDPTDTAGHTPRGEIGRP